MNTRFIHWMNENSKVVLFIILILWLLADWISESITNLICGV